MSHHIELIVTIVVAIFASGGFWSFLQYIIMQRNTAHSAEKDALIALLHDRIYTLAENYILSGFITFEEFDNLSYLYKPYKDLGGNSTGEDLYDKCKKLPRMKDNKRED